MFALSQAELEMEKIFFFGGPPSTFEEKFKTGGQAACIVFRVVLTFAGIWLVTPWPICCNAFFCGLFPNCICYQVVIVKRWTREKVIKILQN